MDELLFNLKIYIKQLDTVIKWIESDETNKDVILIQLEGIKTQMEKELE